MTKELDLSDIFKMSDAMKLAGYEGLPGGIEAIKKAEEKEAAASSGCPQPKQFVDITSPLYNGRTKQRTTEASVDFDTSISIKPLSEESPESAIERTTAPPARFSSPGESK